MMPRATIPKFSVSGSDQSVVGTNKEEKRVRTVKEKRL